MIFPQALLLDVTRRCNAQCLVCGRRFWPKGTKLVDMPLSLALRLIDLPPIDRVCFGQYGEPLLWPYLARAVKYASTRKLFTWMTTNGQLLHESAATNLLAAGLGKIIISIDALDAAIYETLRPGLSFSKVLRNLETFVALRDRHQAETTVVVNLVRSSENAQWPDDDVRAFFRARGADGVAVTPEIDVSPPRDRTVDGAPIHCERPYEHLTVRADGQLMMCCRDCHDVAGFLGDVRENDPIEIFNGLAMSSIRRALETGVGLPSICVGCRAHFADCRRPIRAQEKTR